ncbi:MAG: hypothetical protein Q7S36_03470 [Candidatus Liptonbacteria bacterium]|nr:hypothetical protein [Candidatus Liptonbacteria bacterium]
MPCIEIQNPKPEVREIIRKAVLDNFMDSPAYKVSKKAGAFLQGETDDWILVEFWQEDYQPFVDYLNKLLSAEK